MNDTGTSSGSTSSDYDVVIVGASLAGCTTAILLAREGQQVALVEKQPDPAAFKRVCSHFIQASAVPTLERLELLDPILEAGGLRSRIQAWTEWGWLKPPPEEASLAVNLRRELLDPLVREAAASTPGVDLHLGHAAQELVRDGANNIAGVVTRDRDGEETTMRARLVVGADGRDSQVAEMAGVGEKLLPNARFAYGGYFEGALPDYAPDSAIWFLDPHWAAAFPTDGKLMFYAAMPTKELLPDFKRDPAATLVSFLADLPEGPPIRDARLVEPVLGKIDMTNRLRAPVAPGLGLVGDAAMAADPLFGVGCGWAFQTGEWLADSVAPALLGEESLERGLKRYRRLHKRRLGGHAFMIHDYSTGRKLSRAERVLFQAAVRDPKVATIFDKFATRQVGPVRTLAKTVPRSIMVNARYALGRSGRRTDEATGGGAHAAVG
jgi:2-polyprenyl-6-methoxyphenol hydroxylase-like FAD-dependent oxidoreductase